MIDLPNVKHRESGLWIAARETLALAMYEDFHRKDFARDGAPAFWARGEDVKDHWRKQAQDLMTEQK